MSIQFTLIRRLLVALAIISLLLVTASSVFAANNVVHTTIPVDETISFPLGPEAECFGVPSGTDITVHSIGELKLTEFVSGPNAGNVHVHGKVASTFIVPSTGTSGNVTQIVNFKARSDMIVSSFVGHATGTLPDGSPLKAVFHFHLVVRDGVIQLDLARVNCIKP